MNVHARVALIQSREINFNFLTAWGTPVSRVHVWPVCLRFSIHHLSCSESNKRNMKLSNFELFHFLCFSLFLSVCLYLPPPPPPFALPVSASLSISRPLYVSLISIFLSVSLMSFFSAGWQYFPIRFFLFYRKKSCSWLWFGQSGLSAQRILTRMVWLGYWLIFRCWYRMYVYPCWYED